MHRYHHFVKALLASSVLALSVFNAAAAETLQTAVARAWETHPSLEAARESLNMAEEERKAERSGYYPTLSMTATGGRLYADNSTSRGLTTSRGAGYSYLWEGTATLSQMLFDGFETRNRAASAEARKRAADLTAADTRENLTLTTARAYIDALRVAEALSMLKTHEAKVDDYLSRIKGMVDEGAADESEYQQARDIRVILKGIVADHEAQWRAAVAAYLEATGEEPEGSLEEPRTLKPFVFGTAEQAIKHAGENHPLLQASAFTAQSYVHDEEAEEASLYPDLDGELSYSKTDKRDVIGGESEDGRAVVRMNWNFETGGGQISRIRRAKHQQQEALARLEELKGQVERDVRLAYSEREAAQRHLENQSERVALNETLMQTYNAQFEGAQITLLQLMQGDNQLFTTKLEKMNAKYRLLLADANILARTGRLQEALVDTSPQPQLQAAVQAQAQRPALKPVLTAVTQEAKAPVSGQAPLTRP